MSFEILSPPFPWFGGKRRVAAQVWERLGNVPNYVESFFGSGAVLLGRPHAPGIETVNDLDCYVANFWRAVQQNPQEVAHYAGWPVNEADLHARHLWLVNRTEWRECMQTDPDYYDARIAGWWVWGISQWIGRGWCSSLNVPKQLPHLGSPGMGVHRKRLHLGNAGKGVHRTTENDIYAYMQSLSDRLRHVRVCCGDWSRVCGPTPTVGRGITGVFLDPPYSEEAERYGELYSSEDLKVSHAACRWATERGDDARIRIALCGYEGEHEMPATWECLKWKAAGGYGAQSDGRGRANAARERIWFSPHCLSQPLFAGL
jgi:hypothetical protein